MAENYKNSGGGGLGLKIDTGSPMDVLESSGSSNHMLKIQMNVILETIASKRKRRRISSMCMFRGSNSVVK